MTPPSRAGTAGEPRCINLEEAFPNHRIRMSLDHISGQRRDPWNFEMFGRHGYVYSFGGDGLCAFTNRRGIWSRLLAIPGVRPHQVGDEELVVRFHVRDAEPVFQLLRLYRRRVLADETRQKLQEARRKAANRVQEARTGSGATGGTGTAVQTKGPGKVVPDNGSPGPGVEAPEGVGGRRGSSPRGEPLRPESPPPSRAVYLQVTDDQRDD